MNITESFSFSFSLNEEVVLLNHHLQLLLAGLPLENGIGKCRVFFLENFELSLDLVAGLGHVGGDSCEVTAMLPKELDQKRDLCFGPVGRGRLFWIDLEDFFAFFHLLLKGDLLDESLESGN